MENLDEGKIISGAADGTIRIWNYNGECVNTLLSENSVISLCVDSNAEIIISASEHMIKIWSIETGECLNTLHEIDTINTICISPDSKKIIYGCSGGNIKILNSELNLIKTISNRGYINKCSFSKDGSKFCYAGNNGILKVLSETQLLNLYKLNNINHHNNDEYIITTSININSEVIFCGDNDGNIRIFNIEIGILLAQIKTCNCAINSISINDEENKLVLGSEYGEIKIFELINFNISLLPLMTLNFHISDIMSLFIVGNKIISSSLDGNIRITNSDTGECVNTLYGNNGQIWTMCYCPYIKSDPILK